MTGPKGWASSSIRLGGLGVLVEGEVSVLAHGKGKCGGFGEAVNLINARDRVSLGVANVHAPNGDFVAFAVAVGIRAGEVNGASGCRCECGSGAGASILTRNRASLFVSVLDPWR